MRVAVIGAGVLGAAVAASLRRRGAEVSVFEARTPGAGTTSTSFAWVNANNKDPEPYFALNHAAVRAHHALAASGPAPWFFPSGHLWWATSDEHRAALAARVEKLRARDYPVEWVTAEHAHELEPDLAPQPAGTEYAFFPEEAYTLPVLLLARFLGEARDLGAQVLTDAAVTEITTGAGGPRLTLSDGSQHTADVVVSCVGRWTQQVSALAGLDVPMADPDLAGSVTVGFLATTAPVAVRVNRVLTAPRLNVRPDGGGRLLVQALDLDGAADPAVPVPADGEVAAAMLARLPEVLGPAAGAAMQQVRVGQRPMPADGLTAAGFADQHEQFYVVATHSGITLAPLLGELVADELHGKPAEELETFRPTRFATGPAASPTPARRPGDQ